MKARRYWVMLICLMSAHAYAAEVTLQPLTGGVQRWVNLADQEYSMDFQNNFNYTQSNVVITYNTSGPTLTGTLAATNLKPHFLYQLKLNGNPEWVGNERLGYTGRWWEQEWLGSDWSVGWNLNNKGDGSEPSPNDLVYESRKNIVDGTSDTGYRYKYSSYRYFFYFVTDGAGNANVAFSVTNCYHVTWKTTQTSLHVREANDAPVTYHSFDVNPLSHTQYTTDYPAVTIGVYGEWERLPCTNYPMRPGSYDCEFLLTEESFHGSGIQGYWAHAMKGRVQFEITVATRLLGNGSFPDTAFGYSRDLVFTIENQSSTARTVTGSPVVDIVGANPGDFEVLIQPASTVPANSSLTFTVRFMPQQLGTRQATVRIQTNDPDAPLLELNLTGTAFRRSRESCGVYHGRQSAWGAALLVILFAAISRCIFHRASVNS